MARPAFRVDAVLVQAVIAGALSFAHLHELADAAGQTGWKGWAYPISVDLLLVAAWRRLRLDGPSRLAWSWFLIALVASLGANVATAGFLDLAHPPAWLRFGIAGWPALAFLGGTLLAHSHTASAPEPDPCGPRGLGPGAGSRAGIRPRTAARTGTASRGRGHPRSHPRRSCSVRSAGPDRARRPRPQARRRPPHPHRRPDRHRHTPRPPRRPAPARRRHRRPTHLTRKENPSCLPATTSTP